MFKITHYMFKTKILVKNIGRIKINNKKIQMWGRLLFYLGDEKQTNFIGLQLTNLRRSKNVTKKDNGAQLHVYLDVATPEEGVFFLLRRRDEKLK